MELQAERHGIVVVEQPQGVAGSQRIELCEDERMTLRTRDLAQIQLFGAIRCCIGCFNSDCGENRACGENK